MVWWCSRSVMILVDQVDDLLVIQEFRFNKAPFSEHANIPFHLFVMICIFSVLSSKSDRFGLFSGCYLNRPGFILDYLSTFFRMFFILLFLQSTKSQV